MRWGKASAGSPPKRRTVLLVPEMDWVTEVLDQWLDEIRPLLVPGAHPALFVTERRARLGLRGADVAFMRARAAAGLPGELDLHCCGTVTSRTCWNLAIPSGSSRFSQAR